MRAIAHAVDKQGMINLCFHGLAVPAVSDISPANKIFYNPNLKDYDYDLKQAGDLLDAGGISSDRTACASIRRAIGWSSTLTTNTGVNVRDQMCVIFKQDLDSLGIKVNYRPLEFTTLVDKLDSTYRLGLRADRLYRRDRAQRRRRLPALVGQSAHVESERSRSRRRRGKPRSTGCSTRARCVMDPLKRAPYYWRIQEILHDQLPIIETVRQVRYEAWKNTLENYQPTVWGILQAGVD